MPKLSGNEAAIGLSYWDAASVKNRVRAELESPSPTVSISS